MWIKCNYDESFVNNGLSSKAGWVLRDNNGVYLGVGQATGTTTMNALESELHALIIAMKNCWNRGYKQVIFEGDNRSVTELMNGKCLNWIREAKIWRSYFDDARFAWVKRDFKKPPCLLSKQRIPLDCQFYFHEYAPMAITQALHYDFASSR